MIARRSFLAGIIGACAAPAIVKASSLMPLIVPKHLRGPTSSLIIIDEAGYIKGFGPTVDGVHPEFRFDARYLVIKDHTGKIVMSTGPEATGIDYERVDRMNVRRQGWFTEPDGRILQVSEIELQGSIVPKPKRDSSNDTAERNAWLERNKDRFSGMMDVFKNDQILTR